MKSDIYLHDVGVQNDQHLINNYVIKSLILPEGKGGKGK